MNTSQHRFISMMFVIGGLSACSLGFAEPAITTQQLRQLFNDGKYKELAPLLNKALAAKGPEADQHNRYDLLMLKGETSLHSHARQAAIDAYTQATLAAKNPDDSAIANATARLIQVSSGGLKYLPNTRTADKSGKPQPIDIIDSNNRKNAFAALQKDMVEKIQPQVDELTKSGTLPQIIAKVTELDQIKDVELAATGTDSDFNQLAGSLGTRAVSLMDDALNGLKDELNNATNTLKSAGKTGLPAFNKQAIGINSNAARISDAARQLTGAFGDSVDFAPISTKASDIQADIVHRRDEAQKSP